MMPQYILYKLGEYVESQVHRTQTVQRSCRATDGKA